MKNYFLKIDAKQQYKLALEELDKGQIKNALKLLDRALERFENHIDSLTLRGNLYAELNKWDKTLTDYEKLSIIQPKTEKINLIIGNCHYEMRNYDKAIEFLTKHILESPNYTTAYVNRATSYKNIESYKEALLDIDKAIEMTPWKITFYLLKGEILEQLKEIAKAENSYDKAIDLEIKEGLSSIAFVYKIEFLKRIGEFEKAIEIISKKIEENLYDGYLYYKRATLFNSIQNYESAKSDYIIAMNYGIQEARTEIKTLPNNS
ncbi:tetratricopeptide repeat protein [Tenacibaculum finnmarkense]|uniref:tetratricopeptide repeat protein n=1 Tax=Tenacibaculum finnmarkense TaxID=2781243 RepID=UPI001EFB8307|nr:tetratricopeptide repeat protein [Tenacibaculum finnmarkense]MCG8808866.1 tetratricopeptide repeat protein [Tenacibaculum finnmarkense]MCG8819099.1 tetratricopeptide repeat protein [Tenacibaculum finnmarkense]MCG8831500.1 tetratricopeptide repeat protein [Tenacibaculum finnmarkense]